MAGRRKEPADFLSSQGLMLGCLVSGLLSLIHGAGDSCVPASAVAGPINLASMGPLRILTPESVSLRGPTEIRVQCDVYGGKLRLDTGALQLCPTSLEVKIQSSSFKNYPLNLLPPCS